MKPPERPHAYQGGYLIGFVLIGVATLRAILFYQGQPNIYVAVSLIVVYSVFYSLEPLLSKRFRAFIWFYFPAQTVLVLVLSNLRPFSDFHTVLYFPLCIQVFRTFSNRAAAYWTILFVLLLGITLISSLGW
jgi:hypothetical protein